MNPSLFLAFSLLFLRFINLTPLNLDVLLCEDFFCRKPTIFSLIMDRKNVAGIVSEILGDSLIYTLNVLLFMSLL
jgi:hypothetical protein